MLPDPIEEEMYAVERAPKWLKWLAGILMLVVWAVACSGGWK